jgi:hypothetical protein
MTPRWLVSAGQCKRPRSPQGPEPLLIGIAATSDPAKLVSRRLHRPQQPVYGRASEKTHSWQAATHMRLTLRSPRVIDNRRAKANTKCIDCGCLINRGLRCGPCRDIAGERRRQEAYAAKKAARDKL